MNVTCIGREGKIFFKKKEWKHGGRFTRLRLEERGGGGAQIFQGNLRRKRGGR